MIELRMYPLSLFLTINRMWKSCLLLNKNGNNTYIDARRFREMMIFEKLCNSSYIGPIKVDKKTLSLNQITFLFKNIFSINNTYA